MYRGRYQLGQIVPLLLQCRDASGTATLPAAPPRLAVFGSSRVLTAELPIQERYAVTGLFHYPLFLDEQFASGYYRVVYHYLVSSYSGMDEDGFEVVAGGDADGQVRSMFFYHRPHADYVVHQFDSGRLAKGRNPRI